MASRGTDVDRPAQPGPGGCCTCRQRPGCRRRCAGTTAANSRYHDGSFAEPTTPITVRSTSSRMLIQASAAADAVNRAGSICVVVCGNHESTLRLIPNILNSPRQGSGTKKICLLGD